MNRFALASVLLFLLIPVAAIAQDPLQHTPRKRVVLGNETNQQQNADELLHGNYLILVKVKHGETVTELSV